jgi:hypothetical protein
VIEAKALYLKQLGTPHPMFWEVPEVAEATQPDVQGERQAELVEQHFKLGARELAEAALSLAAVGTRKAFKSRVLILVAAMGFRSRHRGVR